MSKKIAVQKELYSLRSQLSSIGYDISDIEDNENVEAIIYMTDGYDIPYENQMISMADGEDMDNHQAAILINATGKTVDDIDNIISNRIYSPLFE
ncbi:YkuS family protein [Sporosalibacterium faouarense]|uniref:YkuS family protein n=1 Tax=Sporosalibacterium faouarense TaxID=516123 RepID=UPI00141CB2AC|nr:YkuS family protein [Sporosalibacterium faouarense]MTI48636.1 hypothetical protein [Bacillota bacterium]